MTEVLVNTWLLMKIGGMAICIGFFILLILFSVLHNKKEYLTIILGDKKYWYSYSYRASTLDIILYKWPKTGFRYNIVGYLSTGTLFGVSCSIHTAYDKGKITWL